MLSIVEKKEGKELQPSFVGSDIITCPWCAEQVYLSFSLPSKHFKEPVRWAYCACGCLFPDPSQGVEQVENYEEEYKIAFDGMHADYFTYAKRVYAPIVEDLTPGRKFLEVGYMRREGLEFMKRRGWITWGLDICEKADPGSCRRLTGDYASYEFKGEPPFDCVWLSHVIEHFKNPVEIMARTFDLLDSGGTCFVASPDTSVIHRTGTRRWGHWHAGEHWLMWKGETFARMAESVGFKTVLLRTNESHRYTSWNDFHWIGQKVRPCTNPETSS